LKFFGAQVLGYYLDMKIDILTGGCLKSYNEEFCNLCS
jgi:hypothetical protein